MFPYFAKKQFEHDILLEAELDQASGRGFRKGVGAVGGGKSFVSTLPETNSSPMQISFLLVNTIKMVDFPCLC